jgi:hypothetical protein
MLCKAWTDRGIVYSVQGRIFNNVLYVRYVHLTKAKPICKIQTHALIGEGVM